jgi:hypothetical protein
MMTFFAYFPCPFGFYTFHPLSYNFCNFFKLDVGADVLGTPTMGFTLPIYDHDMAMVLAVQPSPTEASTPSPGYDPRSLDFFNLSAEVDNECHSLDSTLDEDGHEGSIFGSKESSSDDLMVE